MRSLDHFAHAVEDLGQAAAAFERLGFQVLPVARHAELGSCNRIFQLRHTYYELVADLDRSVPLLRDRMMPRFQCGDGMAIVSLTSDDLPRDRDEVAGMGLVPDPIVNARRAIPMPDGTTDETNSHCFYVWRDERRRYLTLFLSHHYKPETIFVPAYQRHPNGAQDVRALTYVSENPPGDTDYFAAMFGAPPVRATATAVTFVTPRGESVEIVAPSLLNERFGAAAPVWCDRLGGYGVAMEFQVERLDRTLAWLLANGVPIVENGARIMIPATHGAGMVTSFVE